MAYNEHLAERVSAVLAGIADVREQRMFGGLAFMVGGHMACGIVGSELMVRLGEEGTDAALEEPNVRPMDFTGKPARGMVFVEPAGLAGHALAAWVRRALDHVATLPPKSR